MSASPLRPLAALALAAAALLAPPATHACAVRLPRALPHRQVSVPILMYHLIGVPHPWTPAMTRRLTVEPSDFDTQMRWLTRHGYHSLTQRQFFDALMCRRRPPAKPLLITFDDGYRNVFFNASPTLRRLRMHATAYVITGRISTDLAWLTWPLLHALEERGIEVASHTVSHVDLTTLSDGDALAELVGSRLRLERELHHRVPWLAYPFGAFDRRVEELARRAGYLLATTTQPGVLQPASAPLALHRLRVLDSTGVRGLATMLRNR